MKKETTTTEKILSRFATGEISIEKRDDDKRSRKIIGYAAVFERWSNPLGFDGWLFREKIDRTAFDNVLNDDVVAVFNHDNNLILARNKKTLSLSVDATGLRFEFEAPNSPNGDNVLEALERGDVVGSSFRFIPKVTQWEESTEDGIKEDRTIMELERLIDVGPVTFPAYPDATAEADKRDYDTYLEANPRNDNDKSTTQPPNHSTTNQPDNVLCEWQRNLRKKKLEINK